MYGPNIPSTGTAADRPGRDAPGPGVSVVVPVYDNATSLPELHERLSATLAAIDPQAEIVYVNDGSRDASLEVLNKLRGGGASVTVVDLERNFGQSAAVLAGFSVARGDIFVTIDADLENLPEDVPLLVDAVRDGADLACGVRGTRRAPLVTRRLPSWLANKLVGKALDVELRDWGCGLNAVRSAIAGQVLAREPMPRLPKVEAALLARRIAEVPVAFSARRHGESGYTVRRLAGFAAAFLHDLSLCRTWRRILTRRPGSSALGPAGTARGGYIARALAVTASILCWSVLAVAAITVRLYATLSGRRPPQTVFRIRQVTGTAAAGHRQPW